jgi:hypothetical protein
VYAAAYTATPIKQTVGKGGIDQMDLTDPLHDSNRGWGEAKELQDSTEPTAAPTARDNNRFWEQFIRDDSPAPADPTGNKLPSERQGQLSMEARVEAAPDGGGVSNDAFWSQFLLDDSSTAPTDPTVNKLPSERRVEARQEDLRVFLSGTRGGWTTTEPAMAKGQPSMEARAETSPDGGGVSNGAFWAQFFLDDTSHASADPTAGYAASSSLDGGVEARRRFDDGSTKEAPPPAVSSSGDDQRRART